MKRKVKNLLFLSFVMILCNEGYCSDSTRLSDKERIRGVYKSGLDLLHMERNNEFYLERIKPKFQNDVVVPRCEGTITKGYWQLMGRGIVKLRNDSGFGKIPFKMRQERRLSNDTIYIEVLIPNEDAFFIGRFNYSLHLGCSYGNIESNKNLIKIPRKKKNDCQTDYDIGLVIQDRYPNCIPGMKSYQRIYFDVFESIYVNYNSNYFTISLPEFNQCFVERPDVENDFIFINKGSIYWRGNEYKKVFEIKASGGRR